MDNGDGNGDIRHIFHIDAANLDIGNALQQLFHTLIHPHPPPQGPPAPQDDDNAEMPPLEDIPGAGAPPAHSQDVPPAAPPAHAEAPLPVNTSDSEGAQDSLGADAPAHLNDDAESMPDLQSLTDSDDSDSEQEDVEMTEAALRLIDEDDSALAAGDGDPAPAVPEANPAGATSRRSERRARVEDVEDEDASDRPSRRQRISRENPTGVAHGAPAQPSAAAAAPGAPPQQPPRFMFPFPLGFMPGLRADAFAHPQAAGMPVLNPFGLGVAQVPQAAAPPQPRASSAPPPPSANAGQAGGLPPNTRQQRPPPPNLMNGIILTFDMAGNPMASLAGMPGGAAFGAGAGGPEGDPAGGAGLFADLTDEQRTEALNQFLLVMGNLVGPAGFFGMEPEQDDPERAKKLVAGLDVVPTGLVRRMERVGAPEAGGAATAETDAPGCAICWDSLLDQEGEGFAPPTASEPATDDVPPAQDAAPAAAPAADSSVQGEKAAQYPIIIALPCSHVFHATCLAPWFARPGHTTCPTCRFNIDPENLTYRSRPRQPRPAPPQNPAQNAGAPNPAGQAAAAPPAPGGLGGAGPGVAAPAQAAPAPGVAGGPVPEAAAGANAGAAPGARRHHQHHRIPGPNGMFIDVRLVVETLPGGPPGMFPGMMGMGAGFPGAAPGQPGAMPGQPGAVPGRPGAAPGQPGAAPGQPGDGAAAGGAMPQFDFNLIFESMIPPGFGGAPPFGPAPPPAANASQPGAPQMNGQDGAAPLPQPANANGPFTFPPFAPFMFGAAQAGAGAGFMPRRAPGAAGTGPAPPPAPRKQWAPPSPPGATVRQRVERRERELGLRCWDPSCGVGPSDEDPFPELAADARRQVAICARAEGKDGVHAGAPACEHNFHPSCLISAERVAGWDGQDKGEGDLVPAACPVCRAIGYVLKSDWEEGVRALA